MAITVLYVVEQGAMLKKKGGRIAVVRNNQTLAEVPLGPLQQVLLFGNVQLTTQAMAALLESGVDVSLLTAGGRLRGRLVSHLSKNVFVRMAQHARWQDQAYRTAMARNIVRGKITAMGAMVKHFRRLRRDADFEPMEDVVRSSLLRLTELNDTTSLMGVEGAASAAYFRCFRQMVPAGWEFTTRQRRPPPDPVNALLSLGYMMMTNEIGSLLESHSLDPYLGFLHGVKYGRKALALDLVEFHRQRVVDRMVLRLINKRIFALGDFFKTEEGGVSLKEDAFKQFLLYYEDHVSKPQSDGASHRDRFRSQVRGVKKALLAGEEWSEEIQEEEDARGLGD